MVAGFPLSLGTIEYRPRAHLRSITCPLLSKTAYFARASRYHSFRKQQLRESLRRGLSCSRFHIVQQHLCRRLTVGNHQEFQHQCTTMDRLRGLARIERTPPPAYSLLSNTRTRSFREPIRCPVPRLIHPAQVEPTSLSRVRVAVTPGKRSTRSTTHYWSIRTPFVAMHSPR